MRRVIRPPSRSLPIERREDGEALSRLFVKREIETCGVYDGPMPDGWEPITVESVARQHEVAGVIGAGGVVVLKAWSDMATAKCPDCGCLGPHFCVGKSLPNSGYSGLIINSGGKCGL